MAWTAPTTRATGELITASIWNTDVVNNLAYLKASPTFDGVITVSGAGVHTFSAASATQNRILIENTTSGATAFASLRITAGTSGFFINTNSQGYTPSGADFASGTTLLSTTAGGISIQASAGTVKVYGTATLAATFASTSVDFPIDFSVATNKFTVAAASGNTAIAGTLNVVGNFSVATNKFNVTAASGNTAIAGTLTAVTTIVVNGNSPSVTATGGAFGTGAITGATMTVGRNSSGGGAAGGVIFTTKSGNVNGVWSDASDILRISANLNTPTENGASLADTGGTIVGTQTSTRASKHISGKFTANAKALRTILKTPLYRFRYKSGAYNNQRFVGITTDDSPIFGMDKGRSFNPVTTCAYLMAAMKEMARKLARAEAKIATLNARLA